MIPTNNRVYRYFYSVGYSFGLRFNKKARDEFYYNHRYTDTSPDEPNNDYDDHHTHHQQSRTTITDFNRVSFGSNHSGAQVGINHGSINYNSSSENYANIYQQSSGGGQIFNGDLTAGRDIHIDNTINTVYSLFQSTANGPRIINQAQNELGLLNSVLKLTGERFRECNVTEGERKALGAVLKSCDEASTELFQLKERFEHADEQSQANLERFGLGLEEVEAIKRTLTINTQILNVLTAEMSRSSQANVERLLRKYAGDFENGKRDISRYSHRSLTEDESEIWRQVRKDLQSIGITAESFRKNHDFIVSTIRDLVPEIGVLSTEDIRRAPHVAKSMNITQRQLLENEPCAATSGEEDQPWEKERAEDPPTSGQTGVYLTPIMYGQSITPTEREVLDYRETPTWALTLDPGPNPHGLWAPPKSPISYITLV